MQRHYDGTNWTAWEATGITSSRIPASISWAADRVDLILSRPSPNLFQPIHRWKDGAAWQDEMLDNYLSSNPAAASWGVNRLDFFDNLLGHLRQKSWDGVAWQPWVDLDQLPAGAPATERKLTAVPSVYSHAPGTLDVFALRSGNVEASVWHRHFEGNAWSAWELLPSDHLELDAPDFDDEWAWIGSYSTYRSATFVRLYPDNLLLPSLITHQSPAFGALVEATRPTRRLTPDKACELWRTYAGYLGEVSSLEIGATCEVETEVTKKATCKSAAHVYRQLVYMFGRTTFGKVYWSAINWDDRSGYAQSFWHEVSLAPKDGKAPVRKVEKIIGALPWLDRRIGQHHIYLFLIADELGVSKLMRIRFDLDSQEWEPEPLELSGLNVVNGVQMTVDSLTILPVQSDSVQEAPRLATYSAWSKNVFIRPLNANGDGWEPSPEAWYPAEQALAKEMGDWWSYRIVPYAAVYQGPNKPHAATGSMQVDVLEAALRVNKVDWIVFWQGGADKGAVRLAYADVPGRSSVWVSNAANYQEPDRLRGALPGSFLASSIFVFYEESGRILYLEIKKDNSDPNEIKPERGTVFVVSESVSTLAPHSGSFTPRFFVAPNKGDHNYAYKCEAQSGELIGSAKFDVVPVLGSLHDIAVGRSVPEMQGLCGTIESVYQQHKGASASILTYLAEAYRLVPQQLALNLQSSGEYVAALEWLSTVYDYRAPQGRRYIDYGLAIDAGLPETSVYQHPEDWLLDPLNPHAIALTRRYAYTRFTIMSIIRCLNDFADAEFTYDTDESLVRARLLYTTALELCDSPELRRNAATCEALIGELEIQPGTIVPPEVAAALGAIAEELTQGQVGGSPNGLVKIRQMKHLLQTGMDWGTVLPQLDAMKKKALDGLPAASKAGALVTDRPAEMAKVYSGLLADAAVEKIVRRAGEIAVARAFE